MKNIIKYLIPLLLSTSCNFKNDLAPKGYMTYLGGEKSGLVQKKELNELLFKSKMVLPSQMALNNIGNINDTKSIKQSIQEFENYLNIVFTIEDKGSTKVRSVMFSKDSYGKMLSYANTILKDDFKLITSKDTIYCPLVHIESANSIQPIIRITATFKTNKHIDDDITLVYDDNIFSNGPMKFFYSKEIFENLPNLKLD